MNSLIFCALLISSSGFGSKTFVGCSAKAVAFSSLFLAHVPFRSITGGKDFCGCFMFLVAFQREYSVAADADNDLRYIQIESFLICNNRFLRFFAARLKLVLSFAHLVICHLFRRFLFSAILNFTAAEQFCAV